MVDRRRKIVWLSTRREKKASPLSRGPSTYHRCNSYNVSTQLGLGERERREEIGEGDAYLYSYRRAVRVQRERQRRRHETFTPDIGASLSFSLPLFPTFDTPLRIRGVPPSPCIMYSRFAFSFVHRAK